MEEKYDHKKIEPKWQKRWSEAGIYKTKKGPLQQAQDNPPSGGKCYVLDMFPYPSGDGLHVGHLKGYIATDIYSRYKRMAGYSILHPIGWDAFGLPAENYAIANKVHPRAAVKKNVARFKEQLEKLGFNYDWGREINTTDPAYYKWTQWIFLKLLEKGLAYESYEPINWCPSCQTGLANEDLENGRCERCGSVVEKKPMRQWMLKITQYAERLSKDLDLLQWPESIKESQRNWIGKSEGALIKFKVQIPNAKEIKEIEIFTTRPDTLFGTTFMAISPEVAQKWLDAGWQASTEVKKYITDTLASRVTQTYKDNSEKTGVFSGIYTANPANKENIPVWVVNYVLGDVGTGAIMAVPAHDERDYEFAKKYNLPIKQVICQYYPEPRCPILDKAFTENGHLVNSGKFDGMVSEEAKKKIAEFVGGKMATTYRLKDWVFSRQRYWGEPIPVVHCGKCGVVPVPEKDLPVTLPDVEHYEPTGTGESPLANISEWVNITCPNCSSPAKRETNTMPQWAGSSWYYLRYCDPHNDKELASKEKTDYWLGEGGVDMYVGGTEHATRHLIYARFWHKFLFDIGVVSTPEPFMRLKNQGLIMGEDGRKMSKRYGNVVNPDDMVERFGADTLRVYEMFMGPFKDEIAWSTDNMIGSRRFLEKVWRIGEKVKKAEVERALHQTIKKVTEDIKSFKFNTAISQMMIAVNAMENGAVSKKDFSVFLILLSPFAPHISEELWSKLGNDGFIYNNQWPSFQSEKIQSDKAIITVKINGKVRDQFEIRAEIDQKEVENAALSREKVRKWIDQNKPAKIIYIKGKLLSITTAT